MAPSGAGVDAERETAALETPEAEWMGDGLGDPRVSDAPPSALGAPETDPVADCALAGHGEPALTMIAPKSIPLMVRR